MGGENDCCLKKKIGKKIMMMTKRRMTKNGESGKKVRFFQRFLF